jgi:predicted lipoprotein with Yx(FWY)xxD motif
MSINDSFSSGHGGYLRSAALLGAGALIAACGSGTTTTGSGSSVVSSRSHPDLGTILVDPGGKTVYVSDQETNGEVRCVDECLDFWIPVTPAEDTALSTAGDDELDIVRRSDNNQEQLAYQGKPLYTFSMDKAAGDVSGNNVEDAFGGTTFRWHAVVVAGGGDQQPQPDPGGGY